MQGFFPPYPSVIDMGEKTLEDARRRLFEVHSQGINKKHLSARCYEFFVNDFSQNIVCIQDGVNLGKDYQLQSKESLKKNFTYFRRGLITTFQITPECSLQVTEALIKFLHWVAIRRVDKFILQNIDIILEKKQRKNVYEDSLCSALSGMTLYRNIQTIEKKVPKKNKVKKLWTVPIATWKFPKEGKTFRIEIGSFDK